MKNWLNFACEVRAKNPSLDNTFLCNALREYINGSCYDSPASLQANLQQAIYEIFEIACELPKEHWKASTVLPCIAYLQCNIRYSEAGSAFYWKTSAVSGEHFNTELGFREAFLCYVEANHELLDEKFPLEVK